MTGRVQEGKQMTVSGWMERGQRDAL